MIEQLGVNLTGLIAQIVNLLILFFVLKKFVFQAVVKIISQQKEKIKKTKKNAALIEREKENIAKRREKEIANALKEGDKFITQAKEEGKKIKKKIIKEAKEEKERMIKNAKQSIFREEIKMRQKVADYSADLAVKIATQLMQKSLNEKDQHQLIQKAFSHLKKVDF